MADFTLKGMGVALITPFRPDNKIDFDALGRVVDHILAGGAHFIVVLGTTAETPTLSRDEQEAVRTFVATQVAGRVPLVLGVGGNDTAAVASRMADGRLEGFSAVLSVVPFYNKPTQEGIYRHYRVLADASPVPLILYNVPGRTGVNMSAETVLRLAQDEPRIIGVKEASGRADQIRDILQGRPEGFEVISGDDALTYPIMGIGATGVISVLGNACPKEFSRMVELCLEGRHKEAAPIHERMTELYKLLFADGNPAGIKAALHHKGMIENVLRLPLLPATEPTCVRIGEILDQLEKSPV